jgi:hypothetical protein
MVIDNSVPVRYKEQETIEDGKLVLTGNVRTVGKFAFYKCQNLRELICEEGLETIGLCAFKECNELERVVLPSTLKELNNGAFRGCSKLREIQFIEGGVSNLTVGTTGVFMDCGDTETILRILNEECERRKANVLGEILKAMHTDPLFSQWHKDYKEAIAQFSSVQDWNYVSEDTLERLIYTDGNGIAFAGKGCMSNEVWERTRANPTYRSICSRIVECESVEQYLEIGNDLRNIFLEMTQELPDRRGQIKHHPMLYNRMVCGLRPDFVVPIPDGTAVDNVYRWLAINRFSIDDVVNENNGMDWFRKAVSIRKCVLKYLKMINKGDEDIIIAWFIATLYKDYVARCKSQTAQFFRDLIEGGGFQI